MHILFTSSWFPTEKNIFAGDFVQRHAKAVSLLAKVTVLHIESGNYRNKNLVINKLNDNYEERIIYIPESNFKILTQIKRIIEYDKAVKSIEKYDLIHTNIIYANTIWTLIRKIFYREKYVLTEHWTEYDAKSGYKLSILRKIFAKIIVKNASYIFPVSQSLQIGMQQNGLQNANFQVIPNVVDTEIFRLKTIEKASIKKFLHVSSLDDKQKNISGIINVIKKLKNTNFLFEFYIVGSTNFDNLQLSIVKNQLDNVFLLGSLPHQKVAEIMQKSDCLVLFSNYENQPCVIAESFACGLPVISTNVGGISEFFPENFGFLIEKSNENELYDAIKKVIKNHTFASKEIMHNYAVNTFSIEIIAKKLISIYQKIVQK